MNDKQKEAAYAKVYPELLALAEQYSQMVHVPFVDVKAMVEEKLQSDEAKAQIHRVLNDALQAAEEAK